jgi:hypothetical protein
MNKGKKNPSSHSKIFKLIPPSDKTVILTIKKAMQAQKGYKSEKDFTAADIDELQKRINHKLSLASRRKEPDVYDLSDVGKFYTKDELNGKKNPSSLVKTKKDEKIWHWAKQQVKKARGINVSDFGPKEYRYATYLFMRRK